MSLLTSLKKQVSNGTDNIKTIECFGANYELTDFIHHGGSIDCAMKQSVCQFSQLIRLPDEFYRVGNPSLSGFRRHYMSFVYDNLPHYYNAILNLIYVSKMGNKHPDEHFNNVFKEYKASSTKIFAKWTGDSFGNNTGESILIEIGHHLPRYHCTLVFRPIPTRLVSQV